jgi:N-acetylmuramoyl-L-alanine amidase
LNIQSSKKGYLALIVIWVLIFAFLSVLSGVAHSVADKEPADKPSDKQTTPATTTTVPTTTTEAPPATEPPTVESPYDSLTYSEVNKDFFIFIDAGHGWADPGVPVNENGELWVDADSGEKICEKDINFAIAKKLKLALEKLGYKVGETRPGDNVEDCPVELNQNGIFNAQKRPAYVNSQNPDYFVSIHCNSLDNNPNVRGTRIYHREGYSDSLRFASKIMTALADEMGIDATRHTDNLAITRESDMPTVLVEAGFMTNADDLKLLTDPIWQDQFACALALGIDAMVHS